MIIKSKLVEKDFINVNFMLLWDRNLIKAFAGIVGVMFVISVFGILFVKELSDMSIPWGLFIFPVVVIGVTYFNAKRTFAANSRIAETIEYGFTNEKFTVTGESFNANFAWGKLRKVTKSKKWILVWQSPQSANPIPLQSFDQLQLDELKEILENNKVKNNL